MKGDNPIRKPVSGDGLTLDVQEIFPTIQGEGSRTGQVAIFIRLGGCNLACKFCDTDFEDFESMQLEDILSKVELFARDTIDLVVITGGEPFRQPIEKLCNDLIDKKYKVQIETNGLIFRDINKKVEITCSPKNVGNGYRAIRGDLLERLSVIKFIISKSNSLYNKVPEVGQMVYNIPVYLQPMDEFDKKKNMDNAKYTLELSKKYEYNISLQIHKILGIK